MAQKKYPKRNRRSNNNYRLLMVLCLCAALGVAVWCNGHESDPTETEWGTDGMPTAEALRKVVLPDDVPDIFVDYTGFELSFNPTQHVPNYVAWEITADESVGELPRESNFQPDNDVYGCASLADYRRSGYDRGHMAPAADMKWSTKAMADCHLLTNICPQNHALNAGPWQTLESNCRQWARRDSAIIVVAGPVLTDPIEERIGRSGVAVPQRFFKVVLAPWANPPRGIGFVMQNSENNPGGVQPTAVTIDRVEEITGYDFFSALPDSIEALVEQQCNYQQWQYSPKKNR